jgi:hypothetical protein
MSATLASYNIRYWYNLLLFFLKHHISINMDVIHKDVELKRSKLREQHRTAEKKKNNQAL